MDESRRQGLTTPGDQKVPVPARDWNAMKLALWRSRQGWETALRAATELLASCEHTDGCPAAQNEAEACLPSCPDRELRMSALVILNAARMFAPLDARQPANQPYFAPSRERFSETLAELAIAQTDLGIMRAAMRTAGVQVPAQLEETAT